MQSLDIISVNIWQILISLANLTLMFLILKKFLYGPVTKMLQKRREEIDGEYLDAENAKTEALAHERELQEKLSHARDRAEEIVKEAATTASSRGDKIVADARADAEGIIRQAKAQAELQLKQAEKSIKTQIVEVSSALTEKLLEREITEDDHKGFIDSFIEKIGDSDDSDR